MEILEGLKTRRSVRKYDDTKKIPHEDIKKMIEAACYSPSAHNMQPWEFIVVEDRETLTGFRAIQPWTSFARFASCAIIVCCDLDKAFHREKDDEKWSFAEIDGTLAAYGILLAAHGLGYGACFCGAAPMPLVIDNLRKMYNLPENILPIAIIPIGVPLEEPKQVTDRYQEEKIHWEKW